MEGGKFTDPAREAPCPEVSTESEATQRKGHAPGTKTEDAQGSMG